MAKRNSAPGGEFVELVSPDGSRKETPLNASRDVQLRYQGYLPEEQQKLKAPDRVESSPEKTVSTPTPTGSN